MAGVPTSGEFAIVIKMPENAGGDSGDGNAPTSPRDEAAPSDNPTKGNKNSQAALATAVQAAKTIGVQAVNAAISNIGLSTGNYYAQQKAQNAMSVASTVGSLAVAASNPVTLGVTLAGMAISAGSEYYQQAKEREMKNYQTQQYAKRLGYTVDRK